MSSHWPGNASIHCCSTSQRQKRKFTQRFIWSWTTSCEFNAKIGHQASFNPAHITKHQKGRFIHRFKMKHGPASFYALCPKSILSCHFSPTGVTASYCDWMLTILIVIIQYLENVWRAAVSWNQPDSTLLLIEIISVRGASQAGLQLAILMN